MVSSYLFMRHQNSIHITWYTSSKRQLFFPEFNNGLPFQSSNLKQKAEQAATRTDTIYTDATENKRQLNEDIIPGIERAMADVEGVAAKNKMVKQSDDSLSK